MADVSAIPFINFGESQARQGQADASANLANQQAGLVGQQAQQASMATELQQRAMPLYRQTIDEMIADMSGTAAASNAPSNEARADASGVATGGNGTPWADSGAIAEGVRQQNFVPPIMPNEQRAILQGSVMATAPGGNPGFLERAKMQQAFRVQAQSATNAYRAGQSYDVLTAVADPNNKNPLSMLAASPGEAQMAAQIAAAHPGDPDGANEAARQYAQIKAFHTHQYTPTAANTEMQNGVLVDTRKGAPVTGQEQVLTGLTPEQRTKFDQWEKEPIKVTFTDGTEQMMPRWKAPIDQGGGGGVPPDAALRREDALARQHMNDPNSARPGVTTWDAPTAVGNRSNTAQPSTPAATSTPAPGAKPATGAVLRRIKSQPGQGVANTVPSSAPDVSGPVPAVGTPEYNTRMNAALQDPDYKARYAPQNLPHVTGAPLPGVKEGVEKYQTQSGELRTYGAEMSSAADKSLTNFNAAKAILENPNTPLPVSGPIGALAAKISANLGLDSNAAQVRQEVAKYLVNAAVSGLRDTYGARPGVFDVKINVEKAFPNIENMGVNEVKNLIDSQITQAQYMKQSADRAIAYGARGLEPNSFPAWNSHYFSRSELISGQVNTDIEKQANQAWGAYEPNKYEYRTNNGKLQRRAKQ